MEKPLFPMEYMRITQGYNEGTHIDSYAIDNAGKDTGISGIKAPFTGIIKKIYQNDANEVWIESKEIVEYPDGTKDYMNIYANICQQYFNDDIIFRDLITLLGNLANDNPSAQKIFYNTNLFDEIYNLSQKENSPKDKMDVSIFFLANFSKGISKNNDLINNNGNNNKNIFLKNLVNVMCENLSKEEYSKNCIVSLGELSEIKECAEYIVIRKEFFFYLYKNSNPEFYWAINKILVNLTYVSENINLFMIETYKEQIFPYINKLLDSNSNIMKGQGLFLLGNLIENERSKINEIINSAGFYDKIFGYLTSTSKTTIVFCS